jgi:preprotein translocase subunit SecA
MDKKPPQEPKTIVRKTMRELRKELPKKVFKKIRKDQKKAQHRQLLPAVLPAIGRNNPCPCGSGKKFKKCCINDLVKQREKMDGQEMQQIEL